MLFMNEEGKRGLKKRACEEHAQRPMKQKDVEGRGVGSVTAGARLGRAAEVAARRSADDDLRVSSDERVRRVAVLTVRRGARRQRECY